MRVILALCGWFEHSYVWYCVSLQHAYVKIQHACVLKIYILWMRVSLPYKAASVSWLSQEYSIYLIFPFYPFNQYNNEFLIWTGFGAWLVDKVYTQKTKRQLYAITFQNSNHIRTCNAFFMNQLFHQENIPFQLFTLVKHYT
jgi:hypothetical protein